MLISSRSSTQATSESRMLMHQMESEANIKLAQLKKAYNRLLERHTDLELECQGLQSRLARLQGGVADMRSPQTGSMPEGAFDFGGIGSDGMSSIARGGDSAYDSYGEYGAVMDQPPMTSASANDAIGRRYGAAIAAATPPSESVTSRATMSSRNSTQLVMYNQTAPLDDSASIRSPMSADSGDTARERKSASKIQPSSEIRVYGRGMSVRRIPPILLIVSQAVLKTSSSRTRTKKRKRRRSRKTSQSLASEASATLCDMTDGFCAMHKSIRPSVVDVTIYMDWLDLRSYIIPKCLHHFCLPYAEHSIASHLRRRICCATAGSSQHVYACSSYRLCLQP